VRDGGEAPLGYPTSFEEIAEWGRGNRVPPSEARRRFAQYAILRAIARSNLLRELLVFKGGNALDFVWSQNRSTLDLDFSADMAHLQGQGPVEAVLKDQLSRALVVAGRELGIAMTVHGVKRQPPGEGKTFVTLTVRIGYALPDDPRNRTRLEAGQPSINVVPIEVSLNEPICADERLSLGGVGRALRVSTLEDIVAEKLRAWLQQKPRNRHRPQDLLDVAYILRGDPPLDRTRVSRFLLAKAEARQVPVSKAAFRDEELAARARNDYHTLEDTVRGEFIPYEEALDRLYRFVDELEIPEE
jgi:predicted nucleotidyltransferase component of viral defense system